MRKLFILFLLFFSCTAHATTYLWTMTSYGTFTGSDPFSVCVAGTTSAAAVAQGLKTGTAVFSSPNFYSCKTTQFGAPQTFSVLRTGDSCAAGSTYNADTGLCDTPPPLICTAGTSVSFQEDYGVPSKTNGAGVPVGYVPQHYNGCALTVTAVTACHTVTATGHVTCNYTGIETGATAPADGTDESAVPSGYIGTVDVPQPAVGAAGTFGCPAGSVQGGTDSSGIPICMGKTAVTDPATKTTTTSPTTTSTDASGNSVSSSVTTTTNSDGSSTAVTTTTSTAPSGAKTVTVSQTTTPAAGGTSAVPDADKPKDLCTAHPELNVCQNSTVAGQCAQVSCTGDAIQCATLRQAADLDCQSNQATADLKGSAQFALGTAVANGADPLASTLPSTANAAAVTLPSSLDASGWLGGGQCFPDTNFSIEGQSVTISFSKACDVLVSLRYALMVVALLVSFRILSGAIIRE